MTFVLYSVVIAEGGDFDRAFRRFVEDNTFAAARLLDRLDAFAMAGLDDGQFLRGNGEFALHVVPPRYEAERNDGCVIVVKVDPASRKIEPIALAPLATAKDWVTLEQWAEALLGV